MNFILGIESLPYDLQRNFSLQRDLDQRAHGKINRVTFFN